MKKKTFVCYANAPGCGDEKPVIIEAKDAATATGIFLKRKGKAPARVDEIGK
jgi:hypothetical protein